MQTLIIAALVFALVIVVFASQNPIPVEITFLFWNWEVSLVVVVLMSGLFGALVIGLPGWIKQFQNMVLVRSLKSRAEKLEKERDELQNILTETKDRQTERVEEIQEDEDNNRWQKPGEDEHHESNS